MSKTNKSGPTVADRKVSRVIWSVCKKDEMDGADLEMAYIILNAMKPERDAAQRLIEVMEDAKDYLHNDYCKEEIMKAIKAYKKEVRR